VPNEKGLSTVPGWAAFKTCSGNLTSISAPSFPMFGPTLI